MTIQQCKYVLKIVECGSFNEAAKQLFVAQSSLSVSIKGLEQELGIRIFERAGGGVHLTEQGAEFLRYARQIVEQSDFIMDRYKNDTSGGRLYVSTQHFDFVADVFAGLIGKAKDKRYRFSLREMRTHDVISETESAYCDIGVIGIKAKDYAVMERYISKKNLSFYQLFKTWPHVYVQKDHPLCEYPSITRAQLKDYPYVSLEQGGHNSGFFADELFDLYGDRCIETSDRSSLMNVLLLSDAYTFGTGIVPSVLDNGKIMSIPLESDDRYIIGYILRSDKRVSKLTQSFISAMKSVQHEN